MSKFFWRKFSSVTVALVVLFAVLYPISQPRTQPVNPYILTAAKIVAALGYTPAASRLPLASEYGVTDITYERGDIRRHGGVCDRTVDNNAAMYNWMISASIPGITAVLPPCMWKMGFNTRAVLSYSRWDFKAGSEIIDIGHVVSVGTGGTATCTTSGGIVNSITVTSQGLGYFGPAPNIYVTSGGGGATIADVVITSLLEASAIDTVIAAGTGFVNNETITTQNGITIQATGVVGGVPGTWTIINRGSMADSRPDPYDTNFGVQYTQVSTTGVGTGARFLLNFRLPSTLAIANGGSGGAASCSVYVEPPQFQQATFDGTFTTDTRHGFQNIKGVRFDKLYAKSDSTLGLTGFKQAGAHFDSVVDVYVYEFRCEDAGDRVGFAGYACLAIESQAGNPTYNLRIQRVIVDKADVHGVVVCNANVFIDEIIISSYGRASAVLGSPYCLVAAPTKANGLLWYRSSGYVGRLIINNNEQLIGSLASEAVFIMSTGVNPNPNRSLDNKSTKQSSLNWGASFGDVRLTNVSRRGGFVIDNSGDSSGVTCDVEANSIRAQMSSTTAMTANYAAVMVGAASVATNHCILTANLVEVLNTGTADGNAALSPQPDAFVLATGSFARVNMLRIPNGGVGLNGLVQLRGTFSGAIYYTQHGGIALPGSSSTNPVVWVQGTGTMGSDFTVYGHVYDNNLAVGTGGFLTFDAAASVKARAELRNMRNGSQIKIINAPTDLYLDTRIYGLNTTGQGIEFDPTNMPIRLRLTGYIDKVVTGLYKASGTPTCTDCDVSSIMFGANTTNSNLAATYSTYTVATLPATPVVGRTAIVKDQLAACVAAGAALTGGGAVVCPVVYDGTAWVGN